MIFLIPDLISIRPGPKPVTKKNRPTRRLSGFIKPFADSRKNFFPFYRGSMIPVIPIRMPWMVRAPAIIIIMVVMPSIVVNRNVDSHAAMIGVAARNSRAEHHRQEQKDS
jgi:hypothetical protein